MTDEPRKVPITVTDKRRSADAAQGVAAEETSAGAHFASTRPEAVDGAATPEQQSSAADASSNTGGAATPEQLSLDELQRIKADLENDRKRMMREQTRALQYASRDVSKRMLPVIDHLRLAIEHGEGGPGVVLAFKELLDVLAAEGLEEIEVEPGEPFDPRIHHALSTRTDPSVETDTVEEVTRRGYRFKDHVLRSPEVVVAQPLKESIEG
jgi:molecular chaperone GrpE